MHHAGLIPLDPTSLKYDGRISKAIRAAALDIAKVFGSAAINMMRERNAQTQDQLRPLRRQQAGKIVPPPDGLYLQQKRFIKRHKKKANVVAVVEGNSRVKSMFPAFVAAPRTHPRVLSQE